MVDTDTLPAAPPGVRWVAEASALAAGYVEPPPPAEQVNAKTLQDRTNQALALNATYLSTSSPSAAQVAAQVRRLTQECSALIRLVNGALDSTDGS